MMTTMTMILTHQDFVANYWVFSGQLSLAIVRSNPISIIWFDIDDVVWYETDVDDNEIYEVNA